jgi:hypothetical protein
MLSGCEDLGGASRGVLPLRIVWGLPIVAAVVFSRQASRGTRLGLTRWYSGPSDGSCAKASRQLGQRRFCRRSQLSK